MTPETDLVKSLSMTDCREVLELTLDSLATVSLSRDHLSARAVYTPDTDAVSVLTADPEKVISHGKHRGAELIHIFSDTGPGMKDTYQSAPR